MTNLKKPFNDVTDHMSKIEGAPMSKPETGSLPLGIRIIGYVIIGFIALTSLFVIVFGFLD
ncbi:MULTISPECIES: hypothetical protein [Rossellomorea]|jgi:hypothetical protein|uniref:Uncharacterized protein n=1 Tax=Rossellomorea aquimaris TaxID=189382 RepID=A0A5D4UQM5_9BACI|nr:MULTISPECIES: hypothetical protein [Rossellomorea]MDT9026982.1 hypothetical protein [Rossellomorea sp. YC4-1]TYS82177.1 hypothetical protein FZD05_05225 [Rossellomorea aquimaris]TYS88805.1 hypothetical protein FZC85_05210 [Rossellomorea aquimaris]TYS89500.1 hypothetical protein FZC88_07760 [Rossellomorea aquimaris]